MGEEALGMRIQPITALAMVFPPPGYGWLNVLWVFQ
jgi:hypothetical protein